MSIYNDFLIEMFESIIDFLNQEPLTDLDLMNIKKLIEEYIIKTKG